MEDFINVESLSKVVKAPNNLTILSNVSFNIAKGQTVAILGRSGAGKSTLVGLMAGLDIPSSGSVKISGQEFSSKNEDERAKLRGEMVGFVFQNFQLIPTLNALENVMLPLELQDNLEAKSRAEEFLSRVGLKDRLGHYPNQLSGGEQQRVAIARAFVTKPNILFADEPTGNLDEATGDIIIDLLFSLNKEEGTTLIVVTHDDKLANQCSRTIKLDRGQLV